MKDFSTPYRKVVHFGLWAEEGADTLGKRDAWNALKEAFKKTRDEDIRGESLTDILSYLETQSGTKAPFKDFLKALEVINPEDRYQAAHAAMLRIWRCLSD